MNYIELFAGCGGLSLGLKSVGFDLQMANELSPMAAESYAYNFLKEDLQAQAEQQDPKIKKTLWLSSGYSLQNLKQRLREDPRSYPRVGEGNSDVEEDGSNLQGSLVVGSIVELNSWLEKRPKVASLIRRGFGSGELDLVSGGPPCQSFSMAGLREKDSDKNSLPWEFAKFVRVVKPKLVLLENVTGILRPFTDATGHRYFAWFELAKAFAQIGYIPLCLHVNAKVAGVPQNRPRFIMIGVRENFYLKVSKTFNLAERELFFEPEKFFSSISAGSDPTIESLNYRDVSRSEDLNLFEGSFLKSLIVKKNNYVSVSEAIDDLRRPDLLGSEFPSVLSQIFSKVIPKREIQNHELRVNNALVRRRFRLYQILAQVKKDTRNNVLAVLKGESHDISDVDWGNLSGFDYLVDSGSFKKFKTKLEFLNFLGKHPTKKQTQKALLADQPAPAALSIPDDACHYHHDEQRTLTVREMARIQSFPDSFVFRSKVTTGGKMRSFEAPQYTQVGNAVPPLLGRSLGFALADLLKRDAKENNANKAKKVKVKLT